MKQFQTFIDSLPNELIRARFQEVLGFINREYPHLEPVIKWNQPMFLDHGSFIIGFSSAKNYMSISLEKPTQDFFLEKIEAAGYKHTNNLFQITWKENVRYDLLKEMIDKNIKDKENVTSFWRV